MDYLASFTLLPLRFAGNQLIVNVESPEDVSNRALLLYRLDIHKPKAFQAGEYVLYESLRGREAPAVTEDEVTYSEGCNFDLSEFVWGLLSATPPTASQNTITSQPLATMPLYWHRWVEPYQAETEITTAVQYILRGKINEEQFPAWKDNFFTDFLAENRPFLTWQPATDKVVDRTQPQFFSFLVHHSPAPTALRVRVNVEYMDGTFSDTFTAISLSTVDNYTLYTIPVGFTALGLDVLETEEEEVFRYTVWLSNQDNQRLSEERYFIVNNDFQPYVRHLVFLNSLGGWDSIRLVGVSKEQLQTTSTTFQRQLEANYTPSSEELFVTNIIGERKLTLNTGYQPSREWLQYLEELQWSEQIFVNSQEGLIPIILTQNTFDLPDDEEDFGGRTFTFQRSKTGRAFSKLPVAPVFETVRPTYWAAVSPYCIVNDRGIRTGYQGASYLQLRYTDGLMEKVPGVLRKANVPGTDGYQAPAISSSCAVTPYVNTEISRVGTFLRNNCGVGYYGQAATIVIEAGEYGSDSSQAEAQARAEAAWSVLNTQATANESGVCTLNYLSEAISRPSIYSKNNCSGSQGGTFWTITVPAGAYTSGVSQAAANALAAAYAASIDTQANANSYGSCVAGQLYDFTPASGKANLRVYENKSNNYRVSQYTTGTIVNVTHASATDVQLTPGLPYYVEMYTTGGSFTGKLYKNGVLVSSSFYIGVGANSGGWFGDDILSYTSFVTGDKLYLIINSQT